MTASMDEEPIISPQALARTYTPAGYDDAWEQVQDYFAVVEFAVENPDESAYQAAQLLGLPQSRVKYWYDGSKPNTVTALEVADAYSWDATPWKSRLGHAFNILTATIYGSGTLGNGFQLRVMLTGDFSDDHIATLQTVMETIIGSAKITQTDDPDRPPALQPEQHGNILGRAIYTLGVPKGSKTQHDYTLPEYFSKVNDDLVREFVEVYVLLRAYQSSNDTKGLDFREERSEDYLKSLAELIADVTGHQPTVRTHGIYLPVDVVDELSLDIVFPPEERGE